MPVERAQIDRAPLPARGRGERKPRKAGSDRCFDRRVEPQSPTAGLARVPDGNNLLGFGDSFALDLGAIGFGRGFGGGSLAFLCSSVRPHAGSWILLAQDPTPCAILSHREVK